MLMLTMLTTLRILKFANNKKKKKNLNFDLMVPCKVSSEIFKFMREAHLSVLI